MDSNKLLEGDLVNVELVGNSPTKKLVILSDVTLEETQHGVKPVVVVMIDEKTKRWYLNQDTIRNLQSLGNDTKNWINAVVTLQVKKLGQFNAVVGSVDRSIPQQQVVT